MLDHRSCRLGLEADRGDRRFDLITLRFGIHPMQSQPGVAERLSVRITLIRWRTRRRLRGSDACARRGQQTRASKLVRIVRRPDEHPWLDVIHVRQPTATTAWITGEPRTPKGFSGVRREVARKRNHQTGTSPRDPLSPLVPAGRAPPTVNVAPNDVREIRVSCPLPGWLRGRRSATSLFRLRSTGRHPWH